MFKRISYCSCLLAEKANFVIFFSIKAYSTGRALMRNIFTSGRKLGKNEENVCVKANK